MQRSALLLFVTLACGCTASDAPPPEDRAAASPAPSAPPTPTPSAKKAPVSDAPSGKIRVTKVTPQRPLESEVETWQAGGSIRLALTFLNSGEPLVHYPSLELRCEDPGVEIENASSTLYGLGGETTFDWKVTAPKDAKPGATYRFVALVYGEGLVAEERKDPLLTHPFQVELGCALAR